MFLFNQNKSEYYQTPPVVNEYMNVEKWTPDETEYEKDKTKGLQFVYYYFTRFQSMIFQIVIYN